MLRLFRLLETEARNITKKMVLENLLLHSNCSIFILCLCLCLFGFARITERIFSKRKLSLMVQNICALPYNRPSRYCEI